MSYERPVIVPRTVTENNLLLVNWMGERRFKQFKLAQSTIVSAFILVIGAYSIFEGADPSTIGGLTIAGILVVNGVSLGEWLAVRQELQRRKQAEGFRSEKEK